MRSISVMHSDELAGDAKRRVPLPCKKELRMDGKTDNRNDMSMGLIFQLGANPKAMDAYARLDDKEKRQVVAAARNVTSKSEMNQIVRGQERNFC